MAAGHHAAAPGRSERGGYCLSPAFLGRFREIQAIDPDPLAAVIFRRRFASLAGRTRIRWSREDYLGPVDGRFTEARLAALFSRFPAHAVLFANVLGGADRKRTPVR